MKRLGLVIAAFAVLALMPARAEAISFELNCIISSTADSVGPEDNCPASGLLGTITLLDTGAGEVTGTVNLAGTGLKDSIWLNLDAVYADLDVDDSGDGTFASFWYGYQWWLSESRWLAGGFRPGYLLRPEHLRTLFVRRHRNRPHCA